MEMLIATAHRDRRAVGIHEDDLARGPLDPSDDGERGAGRLGEARDEAVGRGGGAGGQGRVVLPPPPPPPPRLAPARPRGLLRPRRRRGAIAAHAGAPPPPPAG